MNCDCLIPRRCSVLSFPKLFFRFASLLPYPTSTSAIDTELFKLATTELILLAPDHDSLTQILDYRLSEGHPRGLLPNQSAMLNVGVKMDDPKTRTTKSLPDAYLAKIFIKTTQKNLLNNTIKSQFIEVNCDMDIEDCEMALQG
jgi:hypothetical protein